MKILVAVIVLTALALAGSGRMRSANSGASVARSLYGGSELMVVGLLLGSDFVNLIDEATLDGLRPFIFVALGWLAFLFGLQFERRALLVIPAGFVGISATVAVVTLIVVTPVAVIGLGGLAGGPTSSLLLASATLAASAACSGQSAIAILDRRHQPGPRHAMTLLRLVSSLDPVVGVTVFGIALSLLARRGVEPSGFPWSLQWLVAAICVGLLTAWLFVSMTVTRTNQSELVLYILGVIALTSGLALGFGLSVLFVNFLCGLAVANLTHQGSIRGRVMNLMVGSEAFLYLLITLVAGACWHLPTGWAAAVVVAYVASRLVGKTVGVWFTTRLLARRHPVPPSLGLGLASQGGMGLAIIIEYRFAIDDPLASTAVAVALAAVFVSELTAPWLVRRVARRELETVS
jgi:hypothetical protein